MKKIYCFSLIAMLAVFNLMADELVSVPVATLTHDGVATQFYGATALKDAHAAAVSGDVITLNSGTFNACDITKGITLRGACMGTTTEMSQAGMKRTVINNGMRIKVPQSDMNTLKIEDLSFAANLYVDSVPHITLTRCWFSNHLYTYTNIGNFDAMQCYIWYFSPNDAQTTDCVYTIANSTFRFSGNYFPKNMTVGNCVIGEFYVYESNSPLAVFQNCIFTYYGGNNYYAIPTGCAAYNCVSVSSYTFSYCTAVNCKQASLSTLFNSSSSNILSPTTSKLTDEAAATYLGTDGTQVGIYGGLMPFTYMPDSPVVTKCDIANKTTEDGMLKVEIEVKSVQ